MSDKLNEAFVWLKGKQHGYMSRTVIYRRGAHTVNVTAILGTTPFRTQTGNGRSQIIWSEGDYAIRVDELILNGAAIRPEKGDRITDGTKAYELAEINGEPCYREIDHGQQFLCHTKRIAS